MDALKTALLVHTVQELSMARSIERVADIVRTAARLLTGADGATFVLKDRDMCYYVDEDAISPLWKGSRFPMTACISGWAMLNKKAAVIEDIYADERVPHDVYRKTFVKSLATVPIRTMDPIGAIGNYWDTTYKPSEEQLMMLQSLADITAVSIENIRVYQELEQRVKERTSELEVANDRLKDANQELDAFSYSVSHDLRAPLRSIMGYAGVLMEDAADQLSEHDRRSLNVISESANRMNTLIDDLLLFSKVAQVNTNRSLVDHQSLVSEVLQSHDEFRGEVVLHPLLPSVGERNLLLQVWQNLISNAKKYSSKIESPKVEIGSRDEGTETVYFVKDNGAGFDMAYAQKLFGVFQRLHTLKEFEGTGIGLALVKRIVSRQGGRVWAEGAVDAGATFYFSLPKKDRSV